MVCCAVYYMFSNLVIHGLLLENDSYRYDNIFLSLKKGQRLKEANDKGRKRERNNRDKMNRNNREVKKNIETSENVKTREQDSGGSLREIERRKRMRRKMIEIKEREVHRQFIGLSG